MSTWLQNSAYRTMLRGKKVILIGPAPSIVGAKAQAYIDSFDYVVRINMGAHIPEEHREDIGSKTDILYINSAVKRWFLNNDKKRAMISAPGRTLCIKGYQPKKTRRLLAARAQQEVTPLRLFNQLPSLRHPNLGLIAIEDILKCMPAQLHIMGFTFYQSKESYFKNYSGGHDKKVHNGQAWMLKRFIKLTKRHSLIITVDQSLQGIIDNS